MSFSTIILQTFIMYLRPVWYSVYFYYIRPIFKWLLRKTTKLCELQRICYGEKTGARRSLGVEYSLNHTRSKDLKELVKFLNRMSDERKLNGTGLTIMLKGSVNTILLVKKINPSIHIQFVKSVTRCIEHIWGYKQLKQEILLLAKTQYDEDNFEHEEKLLKLWNLLMPNTPLEKRVTKQWQNIGFQGDDPKTDFRGMGILGLDNLLHFAMEYPSAAQHVYQHSLHPQYGYSFAIVGINITSLAYHLVLNDKAKSHVYNSCKSLPSIHIFHHFYCYLFYEFDKIWMKSKPSIMDFSIVKTKFEKNICNLLKNPNTQLKLDTHVDLI